MATGWYLYTTHNTYTYNTAKNNRYVLTTQIHIFTINIKDPFFKKTTQFNNKLNRIIENSIEI